MSSALSEMPQDSVLRRHWQSAREMEAKSTDTARSGGGFFAWLKSLFS